MQCVHVGVFMVQRLKTVSSLGGALLVMGALVSACSTWGGNPPPRYNTVIGEKRVPALNPGGNKIIRPADSVEPAPPANIVRPQTERVVPQSYQSAMEESNVLNVTPSASVAAIAPAPEPVASAPVVSTPVSSPLSSIEAKPLDVTQSTAQQLGAAAPASGGNMVAPAVTPMGARAEVVSAKQEMKNLASERDDFAKEMPSATPTVVAGNAPVNVIEDQAKTLFSEPVAEPLPHAVQEAKSDMVSGATVVKNTGWHKVTLVGSKTVDADAQNVAGDVPPVATPPVQVSAETVPVSVQADAPASVVAASDAQIASNASVASMVAPPVFTRNADGSWAQKEGSAVDAAAMDAAPPVRTQMNTPEAHDSTAMEVMDAPSVQPVMQDDVAANAAATVDTNAASASAGASYVQGDYLPPSRYARYRGGYQSYRLSRLSGAVSTN